MSAIKNRLEKNYSKLKSWAHRIPLDAWRLYDRDIPEYPFIAEIYLDSIVVWDRQSDIDLEKNHLPEFLEALKVVTNISNEKVIFKKRERQEGIQQYEKENEKNEFITIREGKVKLYANLTDYLDTGVFLDHRPMRHRIQKISKGKRLLNLFCYTGSVSVFGAFGGAKVTSVDMSATYLDWAIDNFKLNGLNPEAHEFIQADVIQWLGQRVEQKFDLIFLDPPTFSNSKRMLSSFEVERDQLSLVDQCMKRLESHGTLFFSNNKRGFRLNPQVLEDYNVKDISKDTIPPDFHDQKIHRCFEIRHNDL